MYAIKNASHKIKTEQGNSIIFVLLLILIFLSPIPLGSNRPLAWIGLELSVFFLSAFNAHRLWFQLNNQDKWHQSPIIFLLPIASFILLQILPTKTIFSSLSTSLSAHELLKWLMYFQVFILASLLVINAQRLRSLYYSILAIAILSFIYGFINHHTKGAIDIYNWPEMWRNQIAGTFANKNHFAALQHMAFWLSMSLALYFHYLGRNIGYFFLGLGAFLLLSITLSVSRGAIAALLTTGTISILFLSIRKKFNTLALLAITFYSSIFLGAIYFFYSDRIFNQSSAISRIILWKDSIKIIKDYPFFGTGLGTFDYIFPLYKTEAVGIKPMIHAHNDYLQLFVELGFIGTLLVLTWIVVYLRATLPFIFSNLDTPQARLVGFGLVAALGMLIHASVEFVFQIPALAITFFAILGGIYGYISAIRNDYS